MDKVIIKYSDFFNDDGGFSKIRKDFDELGNDLIKKSEEIKKKVNEAFNMDDVEGLQKYEQITESLSKAFKDYGDAKSNINKIEEAYLKAKKKEIKSTEEQIEKLVELDKELIKQRLNVRELNKLGTINGKVVDDVNKSRVEAKLRIKEVTKEIRDQEKEILKKNELSKKEQKLIQAKITLEKEEVRTIDEVRERIAALRVVVQNLDLETEADKIKAFNQEINDLTDVLSDNSDKFIQSKINIGNYEESIVNALKSTNLFSGELSVLNGLVDRLIDAMFSSEKANKAEAAAKDANTKATKRLGKSMRNLNKILKASIIGVILVAFGALAAAFGDTRAGAIRMEKVMKTVQSTLIGLGRIAQEVVISINNFFVGAYEGAKIFILEMKIGFQELTAISAEARKELEANKNELEELRKKQEERNKATEKEGSLWERVLEIFNNTKDGIIEGLDNIDKAFKLEDNIRRLNQEIEILNGKLAIAQLRAGDSTRSLSAQLLENKRALDLSEQVASRQLDIARQQLELANERVKQNIKANSVEAENINLGLKGEDFAKATLDLAQQRGSQLEISNDLIEEQQNALLEVIKVENDLNLTREENEKERREIQRDLFEQNLDLLIDLIDTEKNLSEQYVNDVTKNFQSRINEFNRFVIQFRQNAQKELDEFTKISEKLGRELKFDVAFNEDGTFDVLINGSKASIDNIVELNKELQSLGLAEIPINRFREFIIETRNGVRDFTELNKELVQVGINVRNLSNDLQVSQSELKSLQTIEEKLQKLSEIPFAKLSKTEKEEFLKQVQELENERERIQNEADRKRIQNRIKAIDEEFRTVEIGSERYYELLQERADLEKELLDTTINERIEKLKEGNEKAVDSWKNFRDEVTSIIDAIFDKVLEVYQKQTEAAETSIENQTNAVESQRQRAESGLENTLAFEQKQLAKREAELIKRQKREAQIQEIQSFWNTYNANLKTLKEGQDSGDALVKTLRDISIVKGITAGLTSFGEGGVIEDVIGGVPTNGKGIIRGRSHQGRQGGIPVLVEGREGIFSTREMNNLGKDNFYKMKELASLGKIDSNFFTKQNQSFVIASSGSDNSGLINEVVKLRKSIESKPEKDFDIQKVTDTILKFVETETKNNYKKRNIRIVKKPRF